jgi:hypothetical protein
LLVGVAFQYALVMANRKHKYIKFNFKYFIYDNIWKIVVITIAMFITIRFYTDLQEYTSRVFGIGYTISKGFLVILVGFFLQVVITWLSKKLGILKSGTDPETYMNRKNLKK